MNKKANGKGTLLERAKRVQVYAQGGRRIISQEDKELALAWANDEIKLIQVQHALGIHTRNNGSAYIFLARALRAAMREAV